MAEKSPQDKQVIVIKKIKRNVSHGRHGGAWKVAYADFVTAMMAFFLLLWLLNSTPSSKLQGIAQFFEPTIGIVGRSGYMDGSSQKSNETEVDSEGSTVKGIVYGVKKAGEVISSEQGRQNITIEEENEKFTTIENELKREIEKDPQLSQYRGNVLFEQTPEGLIIKIADNDGKPMFERSNAQMTPQALVILNKIAKLIKYVPNFIAIGGYTEKNPENLFADYSNWELSADRANLARRELVKDGISPDRIAKVTAFADTNPEIPSDPSASPNRRVSIMLLRNSVMPSYKVSTPSDFDKKSTGN
ncbi:flagellar motor protein MotB [Candidatus Lariskella endosymbiont of Epinotia ramella]|uniref:flagellar motor protein MotB n=1 Tax=Candidatus Lariskella endosymbiont of Epinotia ramella TaxID=3066224 RepID=UPI0030D58439